MLFNFCTSDATSSHTHAVILQSVVIERHMAEDVKIVNDSIVQEGDKECWFNE